MRRILLIALACATVTGSFAGVAAAQLRDAQEATPQLAPFEVPAAAPTPDATHPTAFGYRPSADMAADLAARAAHDGGAPAASSGGASATTITVTATVLPGVTITLDDDGAVSSVITNTPSRAADDALFLFRDAQGATITEVDDAVWAAARAALARTTEGIGTVYEA